MTGHAVTGQTLPLVTPAATWWARVLLLAFLVGLGLVVLMPAVDHSALGLAALIARYFASWGLPISLTFTVVEFVANVVLFVPLGLLLPLAFGSLSGRVLTLTVAAGLLVSVGIELLQRGIPGRVSDPRDLVSNTLGTLIGVLILLAWGRLLRSRDTRAAIFG